jgi:putative membrane-bound dehydrogenase-like protein
LDGLDAESRILTSVEGRDRGVRLRDLDADGVCELIVGNHLQSAVFRWLSDTGGWQRLPFGLPDETAIVDDRGGDAGLRLVDVDVDTHPDIVFSNAERFGVYRFVSMAAGWSQTMLDGPRQQEGAIPEIVRADGTNNGVWFSFNHMWVQNEDTGGKLPHHIDSRHFTDLLGTDRNPPPRTPDESLQSFEVLPGFQVELVAAEPLVMDPVDIAWGPDGKTWIVEYADYPLGLDDKGMPGGRVRCLEDADGDGRYDRSTVFLEPVAYPMGIMVWREGVLVTAAPEVFYAEDTDGDGRADVQKTLFTGFGEGNQQHRVNHPRWGLDNWVHAANGDSGGTIQSLKTGETVNISGRDVRFKPDEGLVQTQSGQTQFGANRDDWGNWFGCNNSNPGWLYALKDHYLRRNPHVAPPPGRVDVTSERMLYPAGRVISHCDLKHRPYADWGKPGPCTSVASVMIYRDDLLGPRFSGNLFVDDSVFNVVHRRILQPQRVTFRGDRGPDEQTREFLASHDIWFRPSTVATGPDGALWVLDMYRFVIEHPEWIDDQLEKTLDLRAGHDKGRIYRIYPVNRRPRPIPRLDKLDTAGLVAALDSPSGWQRDMAHQMLLWRADPAAVEPLEKMASGSRRGVARVHALCVLEGLKSLRPAVVTAAFRDVHPGVRRHAVRVSEPLLNSSTTVSEALLHLEDDDDPHVQMQIAYSLGEWNDPRAGRVLGQLAIRHTNDPYLTAAILSSATDHIDEMIAEVMAERDEIASRGELITRLTSLAVGLNDHQAIGQILRAVTKESPAGFARWQYEAMARLLDTLDERARAQLFRRASEGNAPSITRLFDAAREIASDDDASLPDRTLAMRILGRGPDRHAEDLERLAGLLAPRMSLEIQLAAVEAMGRLPHKQVPNLLLRGWGEQSPKLNSTIVEAIIRRKQWSDFLLDRIETEPKLATILGTTHRDRLLRHPEPSVRDRAESLLGQATTSEEIQASLDKFSPVVDLKGDPIRGKALFVEATCSYCHRLGDVGNDIATDLRTLVDKSPGALLTALVDPNRAVEDKYIEYTAVTADGLILSGMLVEETSTSITLADNTGKLHTVLRRDLDELISMGRSHMPEKLEAKLDVQQMADLFTYLAERGPPRLDVSGNHPATVMAGPDGTLDLRAALCEIYSSGIKMSGNSDYLVWFYKGPNDHVVWSVDVPNTGYYEVWIEWAQIDEYAGNAIAVEVEGTSSRLLTELPSTGGWGRFRKEKFGEIALDAGRNRVRLRPNGPAATELSDLRGLLLVPR